MPGQSRQSDGPRLATTRRRAAARGPSTTRGATEDHHAKAIAGKNVHRRRAEPAVVAAHLGAGSTGHRDRDERAAVLELCDPAAAADREAVDDVHGTAAAGAGYGGDGAAAARHRRGGARRGITPGAERAAALSRNRWSAARRACRPGAARRTCARRGLR